MLLISVKLFSFKTLKITCYIQFNTIYKGKKGYFREKVRLATMLVKKIRLLSLTEFKSHRNITKCSSLDIALPEYYHQGFRLGVLLNFCLFIPKFQLSVAYKSVAYKQKRVTIFWSNSCVKWDSFEYNLR